MEKCNIKVEADLWFVNVGKAQAPEVAIEKQRVIDIAPPGSILVVDDNELILKTLEMALGQNQLNVVTADCARTAIEILKRNPNKFAVAIIDQCMPRTTGEELAEEIRVVSPSTRIILVSGHYAEGCPPPISRKIDGFLHKPFQISQLLQMVLGQISG